MNISYDYYRIFYYVAKYGSFSKAARVLLNNQPNITRTIKLLEAELGVTLFIRSHKGIELTPEGELVYKYVSSTISFIESGERELELYKKLKAGSIRLGTTETSLYVYLLPIIKKFHYLYPNIRIKIANSSSPDAMKMIQKGLVDFALVTTPITLPDNLVERRLVTYDEILVGGREFMHLKDKVVSFEDILSYPIISLSKDTSSFIFYEQLFAYNGHKYIPDIETSTISQLLTLVKENLGLGFLPEAYVEKSIADKEIISIKVKEKIPSRHFSLVRTKNHQLSIAASNLEKLIIDNIY